MSNITIPLWKAVELSGGELVHSKGMIIPKDTRIGIEHYPIFDENHRETLNSHIFTRYLNQEIGFPTIAEFRMRLQSTLALHMPRFNEMYKASLIEFDPLSTMRIESESEGVTESNASSEAANESESTGTGSARNVTSNTPNVRLAGNGDYADGLADAISENTNTAKSADTTSADQNSTSKGKNITKGYSTSPAALIRQRQELLLNIDLLVIESVQSLFLGIWNTYDDYTEGRYV